MTWENELTSIDTRAVLARQATAQLVTLTAPSEVDIALLLDEVAADRAREGFTVLRANCGEVRAVADQLVAGVPSAVPAAAPGDPVAAVYAFAAAVAALAEEAPVAVLLHRWDRCDSDSAAALGYLLRATEHRSVLVVTAQPSGSRAPDLRRSLPGTARLELDLRLPGGVDRVLVTGERVEVIRRLADEGRCREIQREDETRRRLVGRQVTLVDQIYHPATWADLALAHLLAGRAADARQALSVAVHALPSLQATDPGAALHVRSRATEVLVGLELWWRAARSARHTRALAGELSDGADASRTAWSSVVRALMMLGERAEAEAATEACERAGAAPFELAHCRARCSEAAGDLRMAAEHWAMAHRDARDANAGPAACTAALELAVHRQREGAAASAAELLAWAHQWAASAGATGLLARADATAAALGVTAGAAILSDAERAIAELVASGRSNREIAASLAMGLRTVEAHLTRVFRKAGVRNKSELAAYWLGRPD